MLSDVSSPFKAVPIRCCVMFFADVISENLITLEGFLQEKTKHRPLGSRFNILTPNCSHFLGDEKKKCFPC